jgi:pSer/pThr/pTyr-binding forkhead associated (FHA) protein
MAKLVIKFGGQVLKEIPLDKPLITIGRRADNDVVIDNLAVSRYHARVVEDSGAFFIEDIGSTNGTYLNDMRVAKQRLRAGDQIRIGKHVLVYEEDVAITGSTFPLGATPECDRTVQPPSDEAGASQLSSALSKTVRQGDAIGVLLVVEGKTDQQEYRLSERISIVGSEETAVVRLTGWFAPKVAAVISRNETGYSISRSSESKTLLVNGAPTQGRCELKDGDLIEVAGVKMVFSLKRLTV